MNTKSISKLSTSLLCLCWAMSGHAATSSCAVTASSLTGSYGMMIAGQTTASTPKTEYLSGAVTFDGVKSIKGANIFGAAGARNALTGSYSVNSDCTVALAIKVNGKSYAFTVALKASGEAAGIEVDKSAVATIVLKPQMTTSFTNASINGTYAVSCGGFLGAYSDVNVVTFTNGSLSGTDPFNNAGNFAVANNPYTGSYSVNTDGTFSGSAMAGGAVFDFFGVLSNSNAQIQYFYTNDSNGSPTNAFNACTGRTAPTL